MNTLKQQLYYVTEAVTDVVKYSLPLDSHQKARLMQHENTRYNSTDLEGSIRRMYDELDELAKGIEAEITKQAEAAKQAEAEKEQELTASNIQI